MANAPLAPPLTIVPVVPVGHEARGMFVDWHDDATGEMHGGWEVREMPVYPPSPRGPALRDARVRAHLSLGAAARALGISVVDLSGLERGRVTLSDLDWARAARRLAEEPTDA